MLSEPQQWFDAGLNLFCPQFAGDELALLDRAVQAGVESVLLISSDLTESEKNLAFHHPRVQTLGTAGVHPHQAAQVPVDWQQQLIHLLPNAVAVGECGLDFNRMFSDKTSQLAVFADQLAIAKQHHKAVYLHERDAFAEQYALLKSHQIERGIAHCFTGDNTQLKAYVDLGLYIGITGWLCDERRGQLLQDAVRYLPLDRLILETDAPYLLPRNLQPKPKSRQNEPAFLPAIAQKLAELLALPVKTVAEHSLHNARQLFGVNC